MNMYTLKLDGSIQTAGKYTYVWEIPEELIKDTFYDIKDAYPELKTMYQEFNVELKTDSYMNPELFERCVRVGVRFLDKDDEALYHLQYGVPNCKYKHLHER